LSIGYDDEFPKFSSDRRRRESGGFDDEDLPYDYEKFVATDFGDEDDDEIPRNLTGLPVLNRAASGDLDDDVGTPARPAGRGSMDLSEDDSDLGEFRYAGADFDEDYEDDDVVRRVDEFDDEDLAAYNASRRRQSGGWGGQRNRMNDPDFVEEHRDAFIAMGGGGGSSMGRPKPEAEPGYLEQTKRVGGLLRNGVGRFGRALAQDSREGDGAGYKALSALASVNELGGIGNNTVNRVGIMAQAAGNMLGSTRTTSTDEASRTANAAFDKAQEESLKAFDVAEAKSASKAPLMERFRARTNFLTKSLKTQRAAQDVYVEPVLQSTMKQTAGAMNTKVTREAGAEASYRAGREKFEGKTKERLVPFARPEVGTADRILGGIQQGLTTAAKIGAGALGGSVAEEDVRLGNNKTVLAQGAAGMMTGATFARDLVEDTLTPINPELGKAAGALASVPSAIVGASPTISGFMPTGGGKNLADRLDQVQMQEDYDRQWGTEKSAPLAKQIAERGFLPRPQATSPDAKLAPNMRFDLDSANVVAGGVAAGLPALGLSSGKPYFAEKTMDFVQDKAKSAGNLTKLATGQSADTLYTDQLLGRGTSTRSLLAKAGALVPQGVEAVNTQVSKFFAGNLQSDARLKDFEELPGSDIETSPDESAAAKAERRKASQDGYFPKLPGVGSAMSADEFDAAKAERRQASQDGYVPMSPVRDVSWLFDDDEGPNTSDATDSESFEFPDAGLNEEEAAAAPAMPGGGMSSQEMAEWQGERAARSAAGYTPAPRARGARMGTELTQVPDFQDEPSQMEEAIAASEADQQLPAVSPARMAVEPGRGLLPFTSSPFIPRASLPSAAPKRRRGFLGRLLSSFGGLFGRSRR
jgi:hypothetical protein